MSPFRSEPGIVVIEPPNHGADVKCRLYRIQLELCARDLCTVRHDGAGYNRPQKFGACRIAEGLNATADGVYKAMPGCVKGLVGGNSIIVNIDGNVHKDLVRLWPDI